MDQSLREFIGMVKRMVTGALVGLMAPFIEAILSITIYRDRAATPGLMGDSTMGSGSKTRCMARASTRGATDVTTPAIISTIKKKVTVSSSGPITEASKATGKMESNMASVFTTTGRAKYVTVSGPRAGGSNGWMKRNTKFKWKTLTRSSD